MRSFPLHLCVLAALACNTPGEGDTGFEDGPTVTELLSGTHVDIPLDLTSAGHLTTELTTSEGTYTFLLDTGSSVNLITPDVADDHGLTHTNTQYQDLGPIEIDDVSFPSMDVVVIDLSGVNQSSPVTIHGLLGAPFFADHAAYVDVGGQTLWVNTDPTLGLPLDVDLSAAGYGKTLLDSNAAGFLLLPSEVDDTPDLNTLIDTGATHTVMDQSVAESLGLELHQAGSAMTINGVAAVQSATLDTFGFAGVARTDVEVAVMDLSSFNSQLSAIGAEPLEMILGANLLTDHEAIVAYPGEALFVYP